MKYALQQEIRRFSFLGGLGRGNCPPGHERTYAVMDATETQFILCGHTHIQRKIVHDGKTVLDAGAHLAAGGEGIALIFKEKKTFTM